MTASGESAPATGEVRGPNRRKLIREISTGLLFFGAAYAGLGYLAYVHISPQAGPILGFARNLAIGVPLLALGGIQLLSGIAFLGTKKSVFAAIGAVAAAVVALLSLVLVGVNLINLLLAAVPIIIGQRLSVLAKAPE
jgi:hypothetical protein